MGAFIQKYSGAVSRTPNQKMGEIVHLDDFKLISDTSDAEAFQRAHDAIPGGIIRLPARQLEFGTVSVAAQLNWTKSIVIEGQGWSETNSTGTIINIPNTTSSPFYIHGTDARGSAFCNVGFKQPHPTPGGGWAPTAFPPVFTVEDTGGQIIIENIFASPIYDLIHAYGAGRLSVRKIRGQVFRRTVWADNSLDCDRYSDFHIWTYWSSDNSVYTWQLAHTDIVTLNRVDTPFIDNIFGFSVQSALRISDAGAGTATRFDASAVNADGSKYSVWIDSSASAATGHIGVIDGQHIDYSTGGTAAISGASTLQIDGAGARLQINQLRSEYASGSAIKVTGDFNSVAVSNVIADNWGYSGGSDAAFSVPNTTGGNLISVGETIITFVTSGVISNGSSDVVVYRRSATGTAAISSGSLNYGARLGASLLAGAGQIAQIGATGGSLLSVDGSAAYPSSASGLSLGKVANPFLAVTAITANFTNINYGGVAVGSAGGLATVGGNIGAATATTAASGDNSTKVETTAFSALYALRVDISQSLSGGQKTQAITNLGLGTAATQNTGTSGANVPLLNGANTFSGMSIFTASAQIQTGSLKFYDPGAGVDLKYWDMFQDTGASAWSMRAVNDAYSGANNVYTIHRTGFVPDLWTFGSTVVVTAPAGIKVGTTTLITSTVALTNGAAAALGTLTNAPVAGNPTKWIPINDNGTTRYIPAW